MMHRCAYLLEPCSLTRGSAAPWLMVIDSPQWPEAPAGGYFILVDYDQTVGHEQTLTEARQAARRMADGEILPSTFSITTADGVHVECGARSDGKSLQEQIAEFGAGPSSGSCGGPHHDDIDMGSRSLSLMPTIAE